MSKELLTEALEALEHLQARTGNFDRFRTIDKLRAAIDAKRVAVPHSGADESPPVFARRWNIASDGFGMQHADDGVYVYFDDAVSVLHASLAETPSTWMPIESAPKDGTMILLGRPESADDDSGSVSTAGRWQKGWEDSVDGMGCDSGFVDVDYQEFSPPRSFGAESYRSAGRQPTYWMPLPKAP